jgi:hypothetical protein
MRATVVDGQRHYVGDRVKRRRPLSCAMKTDVSSMPVVAHP